MLEACNVVRQETLGQVFSRKFCEIFSGYFWKMKKGNFSVGKYCKNSEKAIERWLTKKLDSLIEILVKRKVNILIQRDWEYINRYVPLSLNSVFTLRLKLFMLPDLLISSGSLSSIRMDHYMTHYSNLCSTFLRVALTFEKMTVYK